MAMQPGENGRPGTSRYEIWPNDQGYVWQRNWGGGEQQPEKLQYGPGEDSVLVTCETAIDESAFEVGCPSVPESLEPLLVTCFSTTCGSGTRPPRSVLSEATLAHRAAISEAHRFDVMAGYWGSLAKSSVGQ
ncbi:hypothetical protein J7T55_009790 [Diaporthe amygdali]|uniref:uncharacterized protein n=1 Tax=Phomopsis amygdali TaxID=1214568 RepID=UPI0022FE7F8C|nr:uncharacterized protein J7T55_009790 [Diaporthe amygdali]KAJ0116640.1 hypothetical protein J7T55_009790 [Diaporthe amygdali]